jgi:hypothetical protein
MGTGKYWRDGCVHRCSRQESRRSLVELRGVSISVRETIPLAVISRVARWAAVGATLLILSPAFALTARDFDAHGVTLAQERYEGREAIGVVEANSTDGTADTIAILKGALFHNGTIEVWVAGAPIDDTAAAGGARGFVGIAFRVTDPSHYEAIYLRPTNGRADDQFRRNHSIQYISHPQYPWERLRNESPGKYEAYADMVPGEWIRCRIVVSGTKARLFLGSADQPSLVVNDLKHGDLSGGIALWIGPGTVAHFAGVRLRRIYSGEAPTQP